MSLTADEVFARAALRTASVEIDGDGQVIVREMSVAERAEFFAGHKEATPIGRMAALIAKVTVDAEGKRIFSDEQAAAIEGWRGDIFQAIGAAAMKINGVDMGGAKETPETGEA